MKKSFLGLAALACAFAGMAVGLIGANNVKTVEATDSLASEIYLLGTFNSWTKSDSSKMYFATGSTYQYYATVSMAVNDAFKVYDDEHFDGDAGYVGYISSSALGTKFSGGGTADVKCLTAGRYKVTYSYTDANHKQITAIDTITSYTVSEYAVVGGVKEGTAFATEFAATDAAFTPKDAHRTGYTFGGWFTDEACTTLYSTTTLTADTTLYAKYTRCTVSRNVYFKSANWSKVYVYTFGQSEAMGAFPGTDISAAAVANLTFNGAGLFATWVYESGDDHIIFNDGTSTNKTADLSLVEGGYYSTALAKEAPGNVVLGGAASVAMEWAASVAASTDASACNMSKTAAQEIVTDYGNVTDTDAKTILNNATLYTWADANKVEENKVNVKFLDMYPLIQQQASKTPAVVPVVKTDSDSMPFMLIAFGLVALGGCASYLLLRKRNED